MKSATKMFLNKVSSIKFCQFPFLFCFGARGCLHVHIDTDTSLCEYKLNMSTFCAISAKVRVFKMISA